MESGKVMTNANVTSVIRARPAERLEMAYDNNTATILVPDNTPIHRVEPGKITDLKAGEHVRVRGAAGANGSVAVVSITIE